MPAALGRDAASSYGPNSDPKLLPFLEWHLSLQISAAPERERECKNRSLRAG